MDWATWTIAALALGAAVLSIVALTSIPPPAKQAPNMLAASPVFLNNAGPDVGRQLGQNALVAKGVAWSTGAKNYLLTQPDGTFVLGGPQIYNGSDNEFFLYWKGMNNNVYTVALTGQLI